MDNLVGPVIGVALLAVGGMGFFTYTMNEDLKQANEAVAKVTQNRDAFRGELEKLQKRNAGATVALDGCNAQLKEAQAKLEAATKTTARRR